jgi:hypothetical protein
MKTLLAAEVAATTGPTKTDSTIAPRGQGQQGNVVAKLHTDKSIIAECASLGKNRQAKSSRLNFYLIDYLFIWCD